MSVKQYLKGTKGRYLPWHCVESAMNGEVVLEQAYKYDRCASIRKYGDEFEAEIDLLIDCDIKEFASRNSARNWCERLIKKDIEENEKIRT